jgi:hypothetical protein
MDIPTAHRGMMFDRTGALAFYSGGAGLTGPVLGPGTYRTGVYDELRVVDCETETVREPLSALTKDGVQFGLDIYVRFSADCSDEAVKHLLDNLPPDEADHTTISARLVYSTYVQPLIGAAVRETISPYRANDVNDRREEILAQIRKSFLDKVQHQEIDVVNVQEVNLSNLDFPDAMDNANVERAVQAILRDKAVAERERVQAEIETATLKKELENREGAAVAARIDAIGAALERHPSYMQFDLQSKMPDIYDRAGAAGNMVITAPSPSILVSRPASHDGASNPARSNQANRFDRNGEITEHDPSSSRAP